MAISKPAGPIRNRTQRELDRVELARRYCRGESQASIGAVLGVSQQEVSYDLAIIRKRWLAAAQASYDERQSRELAKIDHLELTYWEAWERSRQETKREATKRVDADESSRMEAAVTKETRDGNPAFLDGVFRCIDRRCKLLGVDAPERHEVKQETAFRVVFDDDDHDR